MTEALLRHHGRDRFAVYGAGSQVGDEIHPYAGEVMEEVGIDLGDQYSNGLTTYSGKTASTTRSSCALGRRRTVPRPSKA